jgi:hypothetical protein
VGKNLRTEKALIDSGAYVPGDFEDAPLIMKQGDQGHTPGKQISQQAYDAQVKADRARADANRQAWKNKRK